MLNSKILKNTEKYNEILRFVEREAAGENNLKKKRKRKNSPKRNKSANK